jgi:hypothetical protein
MAENRKQPDPIGILEGHAVSDPYTPSHEERQLVGELEARFTEAKRARETWERDATFYLSFLQGNQITLHNPVSNEVFRATVVSDNRKLPSVDNICRVAERALTGKLTRIIPSATVMPATEDAADLRSAMVADTLLAYLYRKEGLRVKYLRAAKQLSWAGTAVFQVVWDPNGGKAISLCRTCQYPGGPEMVGHPCPQCEMQNAAAAMQQPPAPGQPPQPPAEAPLMDQAKEGDVRVILHDPRDFFPEPGAADFSEMRYAIVRKPLPVSEVRAMFPEHAEHIRSEQGIYTDSASSYYATGNYGSGETRYLHDYCYLYEYHEKPTLEWPRGRTIWMANSIVLRQMDSLYWMFDRLPFFGMWFTKDEGEFWGSPPLAHAWQVQRERNKLLSQLRAQRELTLNPQKLVPMQSRISASEWDDQPGRHISYNPMGGKPGYLEVPQFPNYVYSELDRMRSAITEKFAVTDQELGQTQGDPSGRYAAILEAQSSESISPVVVENNAEWMAMLKACLQLALAYYPDDRFWSVTGRDRVMVRGIRDMNLSPGWDVELAEEDSLSKNPALRLQQASNLLSLGVFNDPQTGVADMRLFKRVAGLKLPGVGPDLLGAEHAYAASIPDRIQNGEPFTPRPWDDARIVAEELTGWLRGEGRNAPEEIVQAVGAVWVAYASAVAATAMPSDSTLVPNTVDPAASAGQQPQQQPGQQGQQQGGQTPTQAASPESDQVAQSADKTAESQARLQTAHEG